MNKMTYHPPWIRFPIPTDSANLSFAVAAVLWGQHLLVVQQVHILFQLNIIFSEKSDIKVVLEIKKTFKTMQYQTPKEHPPFRERVPQIIDPCVDVMDPCWTLVLYYDLRDDVFEMKVDLPQHKLSMTLFDFKHNVK